MSVIKKVWIVVCTLVGAGVGALLFSFFGQSDWLMIPGGVVGGGIGWAFGRFFPLSILADLFG